MNRPRRFPLKAWLKYRFGDRSWLVLAAAAGVAGLTVLLLTVPIG